MYTDGKLVYSPLCDVNAQAYQSYIAAYITGHGSGIEQFGSVDGSAAGPGSNSGDFDARIRVVRAVCGALSAGFASKVARIRGVSVCDDQFDFVDNCVDDVGYNCEGVDGLAGGNVSTSGSSLGSSVHIGNGSDRVSDAQNTNDGLSVSAQVMNDGLTKQDGERYVPPFKRGPKGGKSIGRGPNYSKNQAARERRAAAKRDGLNDTHSYVDKGKYNNKASFFDGLPKEQVDELQRTRAEALLQKNLAEVTRQRTAAKRAAAEEQLLNLELESGAFENRIRTRNEATDRRAQDQSENVEFYRHTRGWAETVKSGEPSRKRGPSDVPSLSAGGSPRSESDWELEVKRRDDQNEALRAEVSELRKELETYEQSAYDPMKGSVSVYEPCEYVMDGASRFDRDGFLEEYRTKDRARDFSVPLGTHIRPKEEVCLVGV